MTWQTLRWDDYLRYLLSTANDGRLSKDLGMDAGWSTVGRRIFIQIFLLIKSLIRQLTV